MTPSAALSLVVMVRNQTRRLARLIQKLERSGFQGELLVIVAGDEDPFHLLDESRAFAVKMFYIEPRPPEKARQLGESIARSEAQNPVIKTLDVGKEAKERKLKKAIQSLASSKP